MFSAVKKWSCLFWALSISRYLSYHVCVHKMNIQTIWPSNFHACQSHVNSACFHCPFFCSSLQHLTFKGKDGRDNIQSVSSSSSASALSAVSSFKTSPWTLLVWRYLVISLKSQSSLNTATLVLLVGGILVRVFQDNTWYFVGAFTQTVFRFATVERFTKFLAEPEMWKLR